ncbi:MAG: low molecular weight phosphotyrosine protein phosphatase [Ruminiclostridium sp.]|nr:low molecular weight phosphotyrosine protein phosphatase [Ruminiclostridium sp.]
MNRIVFICHGNICRSPMAEFVMKDLVKKAGISDNFLIESRATSTEEIGNPVHRGTTRKLAQYGISTYGKTAIQLQKSDYNKYDFLICMDSANIRNTMRIISSDPENKVSKLLSFAGESGDIADPWYTGNFDETYEDVLRGCMGLLDILK